MGISKPVLNISCESCRHVIQLELKHSKFTLYSKPSKKAIRKHIESIGWNMDEQEHVHCGFCFEHMPADMFLQFDADAGVYTGNYSKGGKGRRHQHCAD